MRGRIIQETIGLLEDNGFMVADCSGIRSSFDLLAKKENLLLIKILSNIEGFGRENAFELGRIAALVSGIPLLVGECMKSTTLSTGTVYERYGIHVVHMRTLKRVLEGRMPVVYSIRGDYCVTINSKLLVELRKIRSMTQRELAYKLGVSKQSIYRYEKSGKISLDVANRLMEMLDEDIRVPRELLVSDKHREVDKTHITENLTHLKRAVMGGLENMGFEVLSTIAPFDIVADEVSCDKRILTLISNDTRRLGRKIEVVNEVSQIIGSYRVCVSERKQDVDIPLIKPRELIDIKDSRELIEIVAEN